MDLELLEWRYVNEDAQLRPVRLRPIRLVTIGPNFRFCCVFVVLCCVFVVFCCVFVVCCVWCGVWCGVVWCCVVWCGVVLCCVVWCGVVWCGVVWCGVVWCCVVVWCGVCGCVVLCCGFRAVGASHDSPRTPNMHMSGPRPSETPPKFHEKTRKRGRKKGNCGRRGKKSEILVGPGEVGSGRGGPGEGRLGSTQITDTDTHTDRHTH